MDDRCTDLARRWIDAYAEYRDDDLVELAHPEIVVHPRRGQGVQEYRGVDGVRRWLADVGTARPHLSVIAVEPLGERMAIATSSIEGVEVVAVFEARDDKILAVTVYLSDREMLERLGVIAESSRRVAS